MTATSARSPERDESGIELTGIRAEFRTALREEIEAARRNASSSAIPLTNGRRIGEIGSGVQYVFAIENALNVPSDVPGDLILPGRAPIEATIISVEGLTLTVSVPTDLGAFVGIAKLQNNMTMLMRRLISRIEDLGDAPNEPGDRLLGRIGVNGSPVDVHVADLNDGQRAAVASVLGRDTTFIWGPPGTGKTQTLGAVGAELFKGGQSLLIVSHTNAAVDQALLKAHEYLARSHPDDLADGAVIRVGEPADKRLNDHPELLLDTHVARLSAELTARKEELAAERRQLIDEVLTLSKTITVVEWATEVAPGDLADSAAEVGRLVELDAAADAARREKQATDDALMAMSDVATAAQAAGEDEAQLEKAQAQLSEVSGRLPGLEKAATSARKAARDAEEMLSQATKLHPYRTRLAGLPDRTTAQAQSDAAQRVHADAADAASTAQLERDDAQAVLDLASGMNALTRRWKRLPSPEEQKAIVSRVERRLGVALDAEKDAREAVAAAARTLDEVDELTARLSNTGAVPSLKEAESQHKTAANALARAETRLSDASGDLGRLRGRIDEVAGKVETFVEAHGSKPSEVLAERAKLRAAATNAEARARNLAQSARTARASLEDLLSNRLDAVREWDLTTEPPGSAETMQHSLIAAHQHALQLASGASLEKLRADRGSRNTRIRNIEGNLDEIDDQLKKVQEIVIGKATIVATTLTRAYMRDPIRARRFDTVILDEASMAPIPALWVAASLADRAVAAVGDFRQLPPIVISKHELAQRWLGRDVFEVADVAYTSGGPDHLLKLSRQYRMHPQISGIANKIVYDGLLVDDIASSTDEQMAHWYNFEWGHDAPVLLIDTESTGAWVTTVTRGDRSSRLNFLSATICVDLAEQLLRADRPKLPVGHRPRILIVCPYRPHAQLVNLLLREHGIDDEVTAGTAHTFQGSEADIVILDLVNDEPHWRVGLFIQDNDEHNRRLLNVALTRARRRLVVVGDIDYNEKTGKKAFLGRELLPLLRERAERVDALDIVPAGLAARAARGQMQVLGGHVEPDDDRVVVSQDHFFPMLAGDLSRAKRRVVVYSPFITANRIGQLESQLRAAAERGVAVYVVTRADDDRKKSELAEYRHLERTLTDWGAVVIPKRRMHEKLVFVDDDVLWAGSLNPLSFSNTQEVMERRRSNRVVNDYVRTLRVDDLVGEFVAGTPHCPICNAEMEAAEGVSDPFYWRCPEEDCYRRNINQAPIMGGRITCSTCSAEVEFGAWGEDPAWRCVENRRHRQRIARTHLRLPKMRALVPKEDLTALDRRFKIDGLPLDFNEPSPRVSAAGRPAVPSRRNATTGSVSKPTSSRRQPPAGWTDRPRQDAAGSSSLRPKGDVRITELLEELGEIAARSASSASKRPTTADVRRWAGSKGIEVPKRGPLHADVIAAWNAAHPKRPFR